MKILRKRSKSIFLISFSLLLAALTVVYAKEKQPENYENLKKYAEELEEAFKAKLILDKKTTTDEKEKINPETKIDPEIIEKIKTELKEPFLDLLSVTKFSTPADLKQKIKKAKKNLNKIEKEVKVKAKSQKKFNGKFKKRSKLKSKDALREKKSNEKLKKSEKIKKEMREPAIAVPETTSSQEKNKILPIIPTPPSKAHVSGIAESKKLAIPVKTNNTQAVPNIVPPAKPLIPVKIQTPKPIPMPPAPNKK